MLKKPVTLQIENIPIIGQLYLPAGKAPHPTVCVCHGIPSGKSHDPDDGGYPALAEKICREGFAVFIFNFRGTGDSGGNLDLPGWSRDLAGVIACLWDLKEIDKSYLALLGFSGGAAISIHVAAQDSRVSRVAACASPAELNFSDEDNNPQLVIDHFRNIGAIRDIDFPPSIEEWFNGFNSVSPIKCVAGIAPRPLLIVHGNQDDTVNISHAHRLYNKAGEPKRLAIIDGAGHRLRQNDEAVAVAIEWLKSQCRRDNRSR